ncbi:cytochrome P450 [Mycena capillaripes]|nr:cytochrome P450 [Mycena capillaripes]
MQSFIPATLNPSHPGEARPPGGTIIEVQQWMNQISLDTIGLAGFSHDFGTLSGQTSAIGTVFDSIGSKPSFLEATLFMVSLVTPIFDWIPSGFKSASTDKISHEEVIVQINVLLFAGYEPTSISLTWALIELSRNPAIQAKLRAGLVKTDRDLTWDDLSAHGSFLDAFVCEILRFHPPLKETQRVAAEDDILPLSTPIESADGELIDAVFVRIQCMNRAETFWGADAKVLKPSRWLDESADKHRAQEIQGYRHILAIADGPRMCLGKVVSLRLNSPVECPLVASYW